jgi:hypothetical protein
MHEIYKKESKIKSKKSKERNTVRRRKKVKEQTPNAPSMASLQPSRLSHSSCTVN